MSATLVGMPAPPKEIAMKQTVVHDDGTEIRFCIDVDTVREFDSHDGSGATMRAYCPWLQRFKFKECLLGFAKLQTAPERRLHRFAPMGYHNGFVPDSGWDLGAGDGLNFRNWVYCVKAELVGMGNYDPRVDTEPAAPINAENWSHNKYAVLDLAFSSLLYDINNDEDIPLDVNAPEGSGSGSDAVYQEWLRHCIVEDKPGGKYQQDRQMAFHWVDDGTAYPFAPAFWDPYEDFAVRWFEVPWQPLAAVRRCLGKVNKYKILNGAPSLPDGIEPECALLVGAEIEWLPRKLARRYYNVTYYFRRIERDANDEDLLIDPDAPHMGHNHFPKIKTLAHGSGGGATAERLRRFYEISLDGTDSKATGNPFYDLVSFSSLFNPPAADEL